MSEIKRKRSMIDYSIISEQSWPVIATSHSFGLVKRGKKRILIMKRVSIIAMAKH